MAAKSVKESLPSLSDEPHPPNYFPFIKQSIGNPKLVPGAMGRKVDIHANVDVCHLAAVLVQKWSQKQSQST